MNYGFSYMGSKSKIADDIIKLLPTADNFYDLFSGGGAIVHCALLSNKWQHIYANDLQGTLGLFVDAVNGKYKNENRWISREQFHSEKFTDSYIRWIWSFGNDGSTYLYSPSNEQIKREAHTYLFENGYDYTPTTRIKLIKQFENIRDIKINRGLECLERIERLQHLEQLERLQRLEHHSIQNLTPSAKDYRDVEIKPRSVIYCDIPYYHKKNNKEKYYNVDFDTEAFYEWAKECSAPLFFSSSFCEDGYFEEVWSKTKDCLMSNKGSAGSKKITERLYWNKKGTLNKQTLF